MIQRLSHDHSHINYKTGKGGRSHVCPLLLKFALAACALQGLAVWTLRDRLIDGTYYYHSTDYDRAALDSPPPRRSRLPAHVQHALSEPIRIANIAGHFYGEDALGVLEGCNFRDTLEPLRCVQRQAQPPRRQQSAAEVPAGTDS
jgi:hypothetical protein